MVWPINRPRRFPRAMCRRRPLRLEVLEDRLQPSGYSVVLTSGSSTATINDNNVPAGTFTDTSPVVNFIDFGGGGSPVNFAGYTISFTGNTNTPAAGGQGLQTSQALTVSASAAAVNPLIISVSADGFTLGLPPGTYPLVVDNSVSSSLLQGSSTTASAVTTINGAFSTPAATIAGFPLGGSASDQSPTTTFPGVVFPFTMTSTLALSNLPLQGQANVNWTSLAHTTPQQPVTIGDFVWNDSNANGCQEAGEPGIPGVSLTLTGVDTSGNPVNDHQTTDASGHYLFTEAPGTYVVAVDASNFAAGGALFGYTASPTLVGPPDCDTSHDSNPNPSGTTPSTLPGGSSDLTVDFGYFKLPPLPPPPPSKQQLLASTPPANPAALTPRFTVSTGVAVPSLVAVGPGSGFAPIVRVFDYSSRTERLRILAYDQNFLGGVNVAVGDVTGDGIPDIVTGAGPGGGPHVEVFDGSNGARVFSFMAYGSDFRGGVFVASGDVNGDGRADIITGAGPGGGPHVEIFSGADLSLLRTFMAYGANFRGGVRVAAGDLDGNGLADVITGAGAGGGPHVEAFDGATGQIVRSFMAYDADFRGGVFVASGDVNGDGRADIITGAGAGGGPHVKVFDGNSLAMLQSFFAFDPTFMGGVTVAAGQADGDGRADLILGTQQGPARVRIVNALTQTELDGFFAFDPRINSGATVG